MQEDFLHYIWNHKKFEVSKLVTTENKTVTIRTVGQHNLNSGPDFFNAQLNIDNQFWAGNVEIHIKSSDWFLHNHEQDPAYDNVILHVVWEHDIEVYRKDNTLIPTLQIKDFINESLLGNYEELFAKNSKWINCENSFSLVDDFVVNNWLERLYLERLEQKTEQIKILLESSKNDWESVLFKMLAKNFGLNVNGASFFSLATSIDFSIIRKTQSNQQNLEALLFGQANLLNDDIQSGYYLNLVKEYQFLKQKFKLENPQVLPVQFFRLRPLNFPTIRLSQLANVYHKHQNLFSKIIETNNLNEFYNLFKVTTSVFWETHYTFAKTSKTSVKTLTNSFIDLLLINTILPIKFYYARQQGRNVNSDILELAAKIYSEKNSIITAFNALKKGSNSALQSQALIQLKTEYCDKNKCLKCAIGNILLNQ